MARLLRQREDDRGKWDVLDDESPAGARVDVVETPRAAELTKQGYVIASGDDWNAAAQRSAAQQDVARERAGVLAKAGAGAPGMAHALDDRGEPVVASLGTIRQRGWEAVTPETAARAGDEYVRARAAAQEPDLEAIRREMLRANPSRVPVSAAVPNEATPPEPVPYEDMRAAEGATLAVDDNGEVVQTYATPEQIRARGWRVLPPGSAPRPFKPLSGDDAAGAERDVRNFLASMASGSRGAPSRPAVSVQSAGTAGAPRAFAPLSNTAPVSALPPEVEGFLQRAAGDAVPRAARLTDSAAAARPTGDEELRAAQERGELLDFLTRTGIGFDDTARIIAGVGGSARPPPAGLREQPVADLMQRRAAAGQEEAKARAAALLDPASAESERARGLLRTAAPGIFSDEELGRLTAADLEGALDVGKLRTGLNERKDAIERAKGQRQEDIGLEIVRQGQQQAFQSGEAAKQRAFQREMQKREDAAALERAKLGAQKGAPGSVPGTVIPGLEIAPGAAPTADDAKNVKRALVAAEKLKGMVSQLKKLHGGDPQGATKEAREGYGTEYGGEVGTNMAQLAKAIQIEAKTIAELGALSGPDQDLMEKLAGSDPSSLYANVKSFFGSDSTQASLDQLERWADTQTGAVQQVYGYQPRGSGSQSTPTTPAPAASPPKPGMVRMVDPSGVPGWVDASEVQEAEANGYKRAP